jgi:polyhydroxybutyrate depolymerase
LLSACADKPKPSERRAPQATSKTERSDAESGDGSPLDDADAGAESTSAEGMPSAMRDAGDAEPTASGEPQAPQHPVDDSMHLGEMPTMPTMPPWLPQTPECARVRARDDRDAGAGDDDTPMNDADEDAGTPCIPQPPDCEGKPGAPGTTTRMYNDRSYIVHIPPTVSPNRPLPVMFVFHGAGGTGAQMQAGTGFDVLADQVGIVTIYPDGQAGNAPWNVGRNVCPPGNFVSTSRDDIDYIEHMLQDVAADQCIDARRVFATGFSMGGYFSNELGCRIGRSTLRAIAPHSGGAHSGTCPGAPLPVLLLHGDSDSLIDYQCGTSARDHWLQQNGCSEEYDRVPVTGGHCDFYRGCPPDAPVVMCTFDGMDHAWAFPPMYENAGLLIWLFFSGFH